MKKFILILVLSLISFSVFAESKWLVLQTVEIPTSTVIKEGVTRGGNPKFWIEVKGISVPVSEGNAKKFRAGDVKLEVVKWKNNETGKLRYSTRQVKGSTSKSEMKDIDLKGLF